MTITPHEDWFTRLLDAMFIGVGGVRYFDSLAWDWMFLGAVGLTAFALAMLQSTWIVDFTVFVFVFNRGFRRLVDYYFHNEFNPLSPISLMPLVVAASMLIPAILNVHRLPMLARPVVVCYFGGIVYAFVVGFARLQLAAVFAFGEALAPLCLFAFVLMLRPEIAIRDRWIRSFAWAAILASAYGWYQYLCVPPWDGFWLILSGLYGYMGVPEPTQMAVCSTMAERSVLAGYLGFAVVPMIVSKHWRTRLGWVGVVLVFSVLLLTMSRSGLMFALIATVSYLLINRGQGAKQIAVAISVLGIAAFVGMERIPNAGRIIERYETLGDIQEDSSYKGRIKIMSYGPVQILQNPLGLGLGATGMATRLNTGGKTEAEVVDAGYFNIVLSYGIPGSVLLLTALIVAWHLLSQRYRHKRLRDDHVYLARAMMITLIPASFVGDVLTSFSLFWLALGCGIAAPSAPRRHYPHPNPPRGDRSSLPFAGGRHAHPRVID